jgi:DNA invertase Pin-like site-specific DNA recombinase
VPRLYVYSRVSTPRQVSGHGLTGQDEARERWLADNQKKYDLELVEDYRDLGISGRGKNITEGKMGLILDRIADGTMPKGSWLAVDSLDRITRDELLDAHYLVSGIIRAGIIIVTISDGMIFDRADREKAMFNLLISLVVLARSSDESDAKSSRGLRNWAAKRSAAESGITMTGMMKAWIDVVDKDGIPITDLQGQRAEQRYKEAKRVPNRHAATIKKIFELRDQGFGTTLITQRLIADGYEPMAADRQTNGNRWFRQYVSHILSDRAVIGEYQMGVKNEGTSNKRKLVGDVILNYYPAVVSLDLYDRVQAKIAARRPLEIRNRRGDFTNLFAGLCRCVGCGGAMTVVHRPKPSKLSYLRCTARYEMKTCKEGRAYSYPALEAAVLDCLDLILLDPAEPTDDRTTALIEKLAGLRIEIERIGAARRKLIERFGFDDVEAATVIDAHQLTLISLRSQLATVENERLLAAQPKPSLDNLDQLRTLRRASETGAMDERQEARARLAQAFRSILSLIGFFPDGSVVLEIQNGFRFLVLTNSGGRNATFHLSLVASLDQKTETVAPLGIRCSPDGAGKYVTTPVLIGFDTEAMLARLEGMGTGDRSNLGKVQARIVRQRERLDPPTPI